MCLGPNFYIWASESLCSWTPVLELWFGSLLRRSKATHWRLTKLKRACHLIPLVLSEWSLLAASMVPQAWSPIWGEASAKCSWPCPRLNPTARPRLDFHLQSSRMEDERGEGSSSLSLHPPFLAFKHIHKSHRKQHCSRVGEHDRDGQQGSFKSKQCQP